MSDNRDGLAHKASAFLGFEKDGSVIFEKRRPLDDRNPVRKKEFQNLIEYFDRTIENSYHFLHAYVVVHRRMMNPSERSKIMLKMLEKDQVKDYIP